MSVQDHAIVVGVNRYPGFGDLKGPENDARQFDEWLRDDKGGAVPADQVALILSSNYPGPDSRPWVRDLNEELLKLKRRGGADANPIGRRLYLFFAGHGFGPSTSSAALFSADASDDDPQHFPVFGYADWFFQAAVFTEIVLVLDCCRDARPDIPEMPCPWRKVSRPWDAANVRRLYVMGTRFSRKSREAQYGRVHRGRFTRAALSCLSGGRMTSEEFRNLTHNALAQDTKGPPQEAEFVFCDPGIVLSEDAGPPMLTVRFNLDAVPAGTQVTVRGAEFAVVDQFPAAKSARRKLPVGKYGLQIGEEITPFNVIWGAKNDVSI